MTATLQRRSDMAFGLTKKEKTQLTDLLTTLSNKHADLESAVTEYNEALTATKEFVSGKAAKWQDEFDDKSETWQEGDKGSEVSELIAEWENLDFGEAEAVAPDSIADEVSDLRMDAD